MIFDFFCYGAPRGVKAVLFSAKHLDHLAPASEFGFEVTRCLVRQRPHLRTNALAEKGEYRGIDAVSLGQLARGFGEVTDLPRIHDNHRQILRSQGSC